MSILSWVSLAQVRITIITCVATRFIIGCEAPAQSTPSLPEALATKIDQCIEEVLEQTDAPSVSIAIVRDGRIAYTKAYGRARLSPDIPATVETRYGIASVSKQFTAAAILLLEKDGKLKLDDPVRQYIGNLREDDKVTIRQLLGHRSGYRDYWPQDYVPPFMLQSVTPEKILDQWVRVAPDFPAGSESQYSNSNYTVAGQIVEKVSGQPLMKFLQERIFIPLHMTKVDEDDTKPLTAPDAAGYTRVALGPVRPAPKEAAGWLYAAGQLALPPGDLALWNISMIERNLLNPEGYDAMIKSSLGVFTKDDAGRRLVHHDGLISGTTTQNRIWPDQRAALTVVANADWGGIASAISDRLTFLLFPPSDPAEAKALNFFESLQNGSIDRAQITKNAESYFTPGSIKDAEQGLKKLGPVRNFKLVRERPRGGFVIRKYDIHCARGAVTATVLSNSEGQFEQFNVEPVVR